MNEYLIYTFASYQVPSVQITKIMAIDISSAIQMSGAPVNEIICVKLNAPIGMDGA